LLRQLAHSFSSSAQTDQHIKTLAARLRGIADIAYSNRDIETIALIADLLAQLPLSSAQHYGLYYRALVKKRDGLVSESADLLRKLVDVPEAALRARALQTLGIIFQNSSKQADALYLCLESARLARATSPLAMFLAHWQLSELKSLGGDHSSALADLDRLLPLVSLLSTEFPAFYYCFHNDRAVELAALGQKAEAKHSIEIALSFRPPTNTRSGARQVMRSTSSQAGNAAL
jgi:tetratricopeptide (TPR) repeat protein